MLNVFLYTILAINATISQNVTILIHAAYLSSSVYPNIKYQIWWWHILFSPSLLQSQHGGSLSFRHSSWEIGSFHLTSWNRVWWGISPWLVPVLQMIVGKYMMWSIQLCLIMVPPPPSLCLRWWIWFLISDTDENDEMSLLPPCLCIGRKITYKYEGRWFKDCIAKKNDVFPF